MRHSLYRRLPLGLALLAAACGSKATVAPPEVVCTGDRDLLQQDEIDAFLAEGCTHLDGDLTVFLFEPQPLVFPDLRYVDGLEISSYTGGTEPIELPVLDEVGTLVVDATGPVHAPALQSAESITVTAASLEVPRLARCSEVVVHRSSALSLPALTEADHVRYQDSGVLDLPVLTQVDTLEPAAGAEVRAPSLEVARLISTPGELQLPALTQAGELHARAVTLPALVSIGTLEVAGVKAPLLERAERISLSAGSPELPGWVDELDVLSEADHLELTVQDGTRHTLPALTTAGTLDLDGPTAEVAFPMLAHVGTIDARVRGLELPALVEADAVTLTGSFAESIELDALATVGDLQITVTPSGSETVQLPALATATSVTISADHVAVPALSQAHEVTLLVSPSGAIDLSGLNGVNRLSIQGGSTLVIGDVQATSLWMDQFSGPVQVGLAPTMELLSLGYLDTAELELSGVQVASSIELRSNPHLSTLSLPDLAHVDTVSLVDLPTLDAFDVPSLTQVGCLDVFGTGLDATQLSGLETLVSGSGGTFLTMPPGCP